MFSMISYNKSIILIIFKFVCHAEAEFEAIMVADVIYNMQTPSTVIATLCWTIREKTELYVALTGRNAKQTTTVQFLDSNEMPEVVNREQNTVILTDLNCPNISDFFKTCHTKGYFKSPYRWILIDSNSLDVSENNVIPKDVTNIDILPDAEVAVIRNIRNNSFDVHFVYKISIDGSWQSEFYGTWKKKQGFEKTKDFIYPTAIRRHDLLGYSISICFVLTDNDSINHLTDEINDHIDTITKVNFPTTNYLLDFLNASRKYVFADTWGYRVNGSWNGMTGYLVRNEVEIGGSPMFLTSERVSVVDYIASPTPTRSKFVFQQPKLSYEDNLFLLSFETSVWYSSAGLVFLLYLALFAVAVWEWKSNNHNAFSRVKDTSTLAANVADIGILIFGAACQQGSPVELKGSLGRVVMLILFLALMFLYTSYSANIVALLQSSSSKIKTLNDMLHSRLKFGVHDTVFNRYYFSTATEPVRKAIYETKVAPKGVEPRFMSMDEGVKKMQKGLFAFHMETGVGYKFVGKYFQENEKCGLKEIQYLQVIDPWLAVRKNTPYKEMFKIGLKRIQEHGLQNRENRLLYEKKPKCSGRESNFISVSMVDCYPALLVLAYGTFLALVVFAIEKLVHRRHVLLEKLRCGKKYT